MDGVVIRTRANPTFTGNQVHGNRGNGIYVFDDGRYVPRPFLDVGVFACLF